MGVVSIAWGGRIAWWTKRVSAKDAIISIVTWQGTFTHRTPVLIFTIKYKPHLQKVPNQEKQTILGCQWFRVEWNPSRQLVWASAESFLCHSLAAYWWEGCSICHMPSFLRKDRNRAPCENNKEQQNKGNNLYYISGWCNFPNAPG